MFFKLEGNVLFEPAAPMFHLLFFGNVSLKTVVLLIQWSAVRVTAVTVTVGYSDSF